ncbi:MAG: YggT family protein [Hylemonella sp.]
MLYQISSLLLEVLAGVLGGACLLRLYMQYLHIPMSARSSNPLGRFVMALTDWLVLPLRRVIPAFGPWDTASLLGAFLIELAQFSMLWILSGSAVSYGSVLILAFFGLLRLAISGLSGLVIVHAVLSWLQSRNLLTDIIGRLVLPLLAPFRRILPPIGGIDLSPLVVLVLLQIAAIILSSLQSAALI